MMKERRMFLMGLISLVMALGFLLTACPQSEDPAPATKKYTVTFDPNSGSITAGQAVQEVEEGKFASVPTVTPPANKEADGWTSSVASISSPASAITQDVTFTAKWKDAGGNFATSSNDSTANDATTLGLVGVSAVSSSTGVATALIEGGKIKITSVSAGSTTITVSDASNHTATIAVTVSASGAITVGTITKYSETNPLVGAWKSPLTGIAIDELYVFDSNIAFYANDITKQTDIVDKANATLRLAIPGVNGGASKAYLYELNADKKLVIKGSYFDDAKGDPIDFAFTRIGNSTRTDINDIWWSSGRTLDDPLITLLIIKNDNSVYTSIGQMENDWDPLDGEWVRASYELIGLTGTSGTIRWTDGSNANYNFSIVDNVATINGDEFTKVTLP
jgi:hypothetical protein